MVTGEGKGGGGVFVMGWDGEKKGGNQGKMGLGRRGRGREEEKGKRRVVYGSWPAAKVEWGRWVELVRREEEEDEAVGG